MIARVLAGVVTLAVGGVVADLLVSIQQKPLGTVVLFELLTLLSILQVRWQIPNSIDARRDRGVSRGFPNFALRRIDFRYATHVLRLWIAIGYLGTGVLGLIAPAVAMPPRLPFLNVLGGWVLTATVMLGEVGFTVLSGWDFYRRREDLVNGRSA